MGELSDGERLLGHDGPVTILSHEVLHRPTSVYNLEVHGEHVYQVAQSAVLVHNNGCPVDPNRGVFPTRPGATGAAYNEIAGQGIYVLRDSSGNIRYVGRGDAPARLLDHAKPGSGKEDLVGEILFNNNLPAAKAKSLEQELMQMLGGPKSVNPSTSLRNKIQGMGEGNPNFIDLEFAADDDLVIEALRRAGLLGR